MNGTPEQQNPGGAAAPAAQPQGATYAAPPATPPQGLAANPASAMDPRRKSPVLASLLSLMPGLGQVYVGYYQRGFVHILVVAGIIAFLSNTQSESLAPLFGIFLAFFYLYNIVDAGRRAAFYNQALDGVDNVEIPSDMALPSGGGSLIGGLVMVVAGVILLTHTLFGFELEWIEEWWPVAPILFGLFLIARSIQDRQSKASEDASKN
ncbi:MAG: hypothetical protein GY716_23780 [bacterium]|nr:hypothetical protein [bacterium]